MVTQIRYDCSTAFLSVDDYNLHTFGMTRNKQQMQPRKQLGVAVDYLQGTKR